LVIAKLRVYLFLAMLVLAQAPSVSRFAEQMGSRERAENKKSHRNWWLVSLIFVWF